MTLFGNERPGNELDNASPSVHSLTVLLGVRRGYRGFMAARGRRQNYHHYQPRDLGGVKCGIVCSCVTAACVLNDWCVFIDDGHARVCFQF